MVWIQFATSPGAIGGGAGTAWIFSMAFIAGWSHSMNSMTSLSFTSVEGLWPIVGFPFPFP